MAERPNRDKKPSVEDSQFVLIQTEDLIIDLSKSDVDERDLGPQKSEEKNS